MDGQEPRVEGVSLREYVELLVESETNAIKILMAERLAAVQTAYERHEGEHKVIAADMEHLNQLRQEVTQDRERLVPVSTYNTFRDSMQGWMSIVGGQISSMRGQFTGAVFVLGLVFTGIQIAIAFYK